MRDINQMKEELKALSTEKERQKYFETLIKEFDKADALNNRKHRRKDRWHEFDLTMLDSAQDEAISIPPKFKEFSNSDNWDDIIFSQRPEDLHELTTDSAVKALSDKRKEVLFYRGVWNTPRRR